MKYIRTKNYFLGFVKEMSISLGGYTKGKYYHDVVDRRLHRLGAGLLQEKNIVASADTIDDLCDEWLFFDKDNKPHYKSQEGNLWYLGAGLFKDSLRACIFTDKGLIYVAKMNDKGELELL